MHFLMIIYGNQSLVIVKTSISPIHTILLNAVMCDEG